MKNRKGFTLVELLVTILIVSLVIAIGTFGVMKAIESSKKKAFEITKNSVLSSAKLYSDEFLTDIDWVPLENDNDEEKSCVSIQWLINKGYLKKEDFSIGINSTDEYKLNSSDVIILKRDNTKNITSEEIFSYDDEEASDCANTLHANINIVNTTTKDIEVNAECKVKNTVPSDIKYIYYIDNISKGANDSNLYTFTDNKDNSSYKVSVFCSSNEYGYALAEDRAKTIELPTPTIVSSKGNITINYNHDYDFITSTLKVGTSKVVNSSGSGIVGNPTQLENGKKYTASIKEVLLDTSKVDYGTRFTVTAENNDGYNKKSVEKLIDNVPAAEDILDPIITASDRISSGAWHKNNFDLSISSNNKNGITYAYGTNKNNLTNLSADNKPITIPITSETKSLTYYAKACYQNNCSDIVSYEVKLDKTPPVIASNLLSGGSIVNPSATTGESYTYDNWLTKSVVLNYKYSDIYSGINPTASYSYNKGNLTSWNGELTTTTRTISTNGSHSENITTDGSRHIMMEICDNAGNCATNDLYFNLDTTPPTVSVKMRYTSNNKNISLTQDNNSYIYKNWLGDYVTLSFTSKDSLSGLEKAGKLYYNRAFIYNKLDKTISNTSGEKKNLDDSGTFEREINSSGQRYVYYEICDTAGNCSKPDVTFKIDDDFPIVTFDGNSGNYYYFSCSSNSGVSEFKTYDSVSGNGTISNESNGNKKSSHYWNPNKRPNIDITCKSNSGHSSTYSYRYSTTTSNSLCYDIIEDAYWNGSSINNPCNIIETVTCNGQTIKKNTNCNMPGRTKLFNGVEKPVITYYRWSCCTSQSSRSDLVLVSKN